MNNNNRGKTLSPTICSNSVSFTSINCSSCSSHSNPFHGVVWIGDLIWWILSRRGENGSMTSIGQAFNAPTEREDVHSAAGSCLGKSRWSSRVRSLLRLIDWMFEWHRLLSSRSSAEREKQKWWCYSRVLSLHLFVLLDGFKRTKEFLVVRRWWRHRCDSEREIQSMMV